MAENNNQQQSSPSPKKFKWSVWHVIAIALIGIFLVLTLSNMDAILSPIGKLASLLTPITIGLVLAYFLNFFVRFFEYKLFRGIKKRTLNRALSMLCSYLLFFALIAGLFLLIIPSLISSISQISANGTKYIEDLLNSINELLSEWNLPFLEKPEDGITYLTLEKLSTWLLEFLSSTGSSLQAIIEKSFDVAFGTARDALFALADIAVGFFISIYVLLSKERLNAGCRRVFRALFSKKNEDRVLSYFSRAHSKFGGFIIGKLADSTAVMLVCMLLFSIFKIPYPILIAVIIGITDIIPFFGPFLGAIPSALLIFLIDPWMVPLFVILILIVQQIDGNFLAPLILGDRTGLSSLGVIVGVTLMGGIFGITGMLIGVPLFALIVSILDDFVTSRLRAKGEPISLYKYYPADAFIRPQDENTEESTLLQRFSRWVSSVETEHIEAGKRIGFWRGFGRAVRKILLAIGRFFHHLFSIKPVPEDQKSGIYISISTHGVPTKHSVLRTILLAIPTLLLYPLYVVAVISQSINIICREDGKRTWGVFPFLVFSVITLGIFPIVWHCSVINRMKAHCARHNIECHISKTYYLCWGLLGLPLLIGPLLASAHFLRAFREIAQHFNDTHTFPLSAEVLNSEIPESAEGTRPRKSIIEQIIAPEDPLPETVDDDDDDDDDYDENNFVIN